MKLLNLIFLTSLLILNGCLSNTKNDETKSPYYTSEGFQIINKEWMDMNKWVGQSIRFNIVSEPISDTASRFFVKIYDVDDDLELINSPHKLVEDTIFVDTTEMRILNHHSFYLSQNDTTFLQFKSVSENLKPWPEPLGLLFKKKGLYYYIDTTFYYKRNLEEL